MRDLNPRPWLKIWGIPTELTRETQKLKSEWIYRLMYALPTWHLAVTTRKNIYLTVKVSSRKDVNIKQENVNIKLGVARWGTWTRDPQIKIWCSTDWANRAHGNNVEKYVYNS